MKKFLILLAITVIGINGCKKFDDSKLWNSIGELDKRVEALEEFCNKMNANISSLQSILKSLEAKEYVTNVVDLPNGEGYIISFTSGKIITIYHGKNGNDGQNGTDGATPVIGVRKGTDGIYYWTVNNEWLIVDGHKVKATGDNGTDGSDGTNGSDGKDGIDGVTPKFKIENDYWYISYDNGKSWEQLGKATGGNGSDGADGSDGKDGITPTFKIENGYWYVSYDNGMTWTEIGKATGENGSNGSDGSNGADGKDGITPQLKIEDGYWYISYDNKETWDKLDKATGADGDSIFLSVSQDDNNAYFTLKDGTVITIPKKGEANMQVSFNCEDKVYCLPEKNVKISYEIVNSYSAVSITYIPLNDWNILIEKQSNTRGNIIITAPKQFEQTQISIFICDGIQTIMKTIDICKADLDLIERHEFSYQSGNYFIPFSANINYNIELENNATWVSLEPGTNQNILLTLEENNNSTFRSTLIQITDVTGSIIKRLYICQDSYKTKYININGANFKMIYVPGGLFQNKDVDERISSFYIGETEVTEDLYSAVMEKTANGIMNGKSGLSYNSWKEFISKLNTFSNNTFSIAMRSNWLYAAQGGKYSPKYKYSGSDDKEFVCAKEIGEVKTALPNQLGIYDMSGNLMEYGYEKKYVHSFGGDAKPGSLNYYILKYNESDLGGYTVGETAEANEITNWGIRLMIKE